MYWYNYIQAWLGKWSGQPRHSETTVGDGIQIYQG